MTYYLYVDCAGHPDITQHELNPESHPGHTLLETSEEPILYPGNRYVDGKWLSEDPIPQYAYDRQSAYARIPEQLDMLWHAMNSGEFPKAEPFYSHIKAVKDKYPKPE